MLVNKLTGETYANRKEAKMKLGHPVYNKMVKEQTISFHSDITVYRADEIIY